jgi:hypothetical protein
LEGGQSWYSFVPCFASASASAIDILLDWLAESSPQTQHINSASQTWHEADATLTSESVKDWLDWRAPKVARNWFDLSQRGWTDFASRLRGEGLLKEHPVSGDRLVSIHRSVFARHGRDLPSNVALFSL